jgi:anti-sigma regulatory factor (Ser/Thr protein kinase)
MATGVAQPFRIRLPPTFWSARTARYEVAGALDEWGWRERSEAAQLIVSELVTNAVEHAATAVEISMRVDESLLRLEVSDAGGGQPVRKEVKPGDPSGRGLNIVAFLAQEWGATVEPGCTTVWCTLTR